MKALFIAATTVATLSAGAALAGNDITVCEVTGDGFGQITREDGSMHTLYSPLITEDALFASDGSAGATKICDRTDEKQVQDVEITSDLLVSDSYICGVALPTSEIGSVNVVETGEIDSTVSAVFMSQMVPDSVEGAIGSCLIDGVELAPAVPQDQVYKYVL